MTVGLARRATAKKVAFLGLGAAAGLLLQLVLGWSPAEAEELVIPWTVEQASPTSGDFCVETATEDCDDFRAQCRAAGGGTTSTGAGGIAIVNCITIPSPPGGGSGSPTPGAGDFCVETATEDCDDFRAQCRAAGGGTTSTGAGGIAIVNCITIPSPPGGGSGSPVFPGSGDFCVETSTNSCDDFRASCRANGGGTTSTGAGDIAVISCVSIPPIPQ